jgi:type IV secretion system protein VirB3
MRELDIIPIYSSLNRPLLIMGGERELMMLIALISLTMIFVALSFQSAILGLIIWFVFSSVLRMMAKTDPLLSKIFKRQFNYQKYYPALPTPFGRV